MNTTMQTMGRSPRLLASLLVLLGIVVPLRQAGLSGLNSLPVAAQSDETPLDLPAMALTPADLAEAGFPGYRLLDGQLVGPAKLAGVLGDWTDQITNDDLRGILEDDGLRRGFEFDLRLQQQPDDPRSPAVRDLYNSVYEFAGAGGARKAFSYLSKLSSESDGIAVQPLSGEDRIGDNSALVRTEFTVGTHQTQELVFMFRAGRIIALIRTWDYTGEEPPIADAQAMATPLLERVETALAGETPGLGPRVLRLASGEIRRDGYFRRDGEDLPPSGESADDLAGRRAFAGNATDMYEFIERLQIDDRDFDGVVFYGIRLYLFPDTASAKNWFDNQRAEPAAGPNARHMAVHDLTVIEDAPTFGDESFTLSYTTEESDGYTTDVVETRLRIGTVTADLDVSLRADYPLIAAAEAMTARQVACLGDAECLDPVTVADALATKIPGPKQEVTLDHPEIVLTPTELDTP